MNTAHAPGSRRRDIMVAAACGVFVAAMVGAAYAAVPLYNWFCRTTGFAGTPQVASAAPGQVLDRKITVRFDANVPGGLPWRFAPEQNSVEVKFGEVVTVNYTVVNEAARETVGIASYNVSPPTVGGLFLQDQLFLLHRSAPEAGREARDDGRVLPGSRNWRRIPSRTVSTPLRCPTPCIRCASPSRRARRAGGRPGGAEATCRARGKRAAEEDGDRRWPTPTPSRTTTTIWSIRARGRSVGSISAFLMAVGGITWMHHMFAAAPYIFGVGVLGMAYTMIGWWRDVDREADLRGLSYARGADLPSLRDDPVHRL